MTPDQRRNLPPQAQKQYSERPVSGQDVKDLLAKTMYGAHSTGDVLAEVERVANGVDTLTRNLDAAEDTLALIAANGPVGVKMAVAKAQNEKPPPFPICDPLEWRQKATGEYYVYNLSLYELERALLDALGFDESYQIMLDHPEWIGMPMIFRIAKGDEFIGPMCRLPNLGSA